MNDQEFDLIKEIAAKLARKHYLGTLYEAGDLYGAGWEAVNEFYAKGSKTELAIIIRRRMVDHVRTLRKRYATAVTTPFSLDSIPSEFLDDSGTIAIMEREAFEDAIKGLGPYDKTLIKWYVDVEFTMKQIGELLGITESGVSRYFKERIFPQLRELMTND